MRVSPLRLALSAALLAGVALMVPAQAAPVPNGATWTEEWISSGDGTPLHADVLLPEARKDGQKHPVVLAIGPYFGSGSQTLVYGATNEGPSARFDDLVEEGRIFERGYAYVMVDSRGYGSSGGCNDLGGPGEQMDVKAAVEWAAQQPWSNGKVGMWGKSYDAWTQVMALATKPKGLAATVIQSPLIEAYRGFFDNGVHWPAQWYATPALYGHTDLTPPSLTGSPDEFANALTGTATNPHCYAQNLTLTANPDRTAAYWQERDLVDAAAASKVPSLWSFGFNDVNTRPTNIFDVYSRLQGPKRAWFGQWDHVRGNESDLVGREGFMDEAMSWFDHHLKGLPLKRLPNHEIQDGDGRWRAEASYPPADAVARTMPVLEGSYTDQRGNSASNPTGSGSWTVTQPAPHDVRLAGLPELTVEASVPTPAGANLIALLYDVAPGGDARLVTRGAYKLPASGSTTFELHPADWLLPKGHRFALQLSGDDTTTYQPTWTGSTVGVKGALRLPLLTKARRSFLAGDEAQAQASVPAPTLDEAAFDGRQVRADFGRPMGG